MSGSERLTEGMEIRPARDGGFVVIRPCSGGLAGALFFAGELEACLDYLRLKFTPRVGLAVFTAPKGEKS